MKCNCNEGNIKVKKLCPNANIPKKNNPSDSGFDVCSTIEKVLYPGERYAFPTGLSFEIPENFEIQVRPRSGMALNHGITVLNTPGTIDQEFRGEVKVILINHGLNDFEIKVGDRIAQLIPAKTTNVEMVEVYEIKETVRGVNGFGSSGV